MYLDCQCSYSKHLKKNKYAEKYNKTGVILFHLYVPNAPLIMADPGLELRKRGGGDGFDLPALLAFSLLSFRLFLPPRSATASSQPPVSSTPKVAGEERFHHPNKASWSYVLCNF